MFVEPIDTGFRELAVVAVRRRSGKGRFGAENAVDRATGDLVAHPPLVSELARLGQGFRRLREPHDSVVIFLTEHKYIPLHIDGNSVRKYREREALGLCWCISESNESQEIALGGVGVWIRVMTGSLEVSRVF